DARHDRARAGPAAARAAPRAARALHVRLSGEPGPSRRGGEGMERLAGEAIQPRRDAREGARLPHQVIERLVKYPMKCPSRPPSQHTSPMPMTARNAEGGRAGP